MERFYKRKSEAEAVVPPVPVPPTVVAENSQNIIRDESRVINLATLESDPGLRIPIENYNVNIQDEVRRRYMLQGPCQPDNHIFPLTKFGQKCRRFNPKWFKEFSNWLEYSIKKDAAFCLCCYLFKDVAWENDAFVCKGYSNWKKKDRIEKHVGGPDSAHNYA